MRRSSRPRPAPRPPGRPGRAERPAAAARAPRSGSGPDLPAWPASRSSGPPGEAGLDRGVSPADERATLVHRVGRVDVAVHSPEVDALSPGGPGRAARGGEPVALDPHVDPTRAA